MSGRVFLLACLLALPLGAQALDREARDTLARSGRLRAIIDAHREATGALPESEIHLGVLIRIQGARAPLQGERPIDAWGAAFVYRIDPEQEAGYALYSRGPNGRDDTGQGDDLGLARAAHLTPAMLKAQTLLPMAFLVVVAPLAWALIRRAKRLLG